MEAVQEFQKLAYGLVIAAVSGFLGYWLKYYLEKKKELLVAIRSERKSIYDEFFDAHLSLLTKNKKGEMLNQNEMNALFLKIQEMYKKYMLYASEKGIKYYGEYYQSVLSISTDENLKEVLKKLTKVLGLMRKDLGLSNNGLGKDNILLLRPLINDFDSIFMHRMQKKNKKVKGNE